MNTRQPQDVTMVYFIKDHASGLVKIGKTDYPIYLRLFTLFNANPNPLEVIGVHKAIEKDIHDRFDAFRVFNEWFEDSLALRDFIASADVPSLHPTAEQLARSCWHCKSRKKHPGADRFGRCPTHSKPTPKTA